MSEIVADPVVDESTDAAVEAAPTTQPVEDAATIARRLAGKDQALTRTQRERDEIKAEADRLRAKVLEYEQANLTEAQRLQQERDRLASDLAAAKAEAQRERLARKFPLAFDALGEHVPLDEDALSSLEQRLAAAKAEPEAEPVIDPNSPRRTPIRQSAARTLEDDKRDLVSLGNPYFDDSHWGSTRG